MRKPLVLIGTLALLAISASGSAATPDAPLVATVQAFVDGFNKGDMKAAAAALSSDVVIIDDVPPHVWSGPGAFEAWSKTLNAASQAEGDTDETVTLGKPTRALAQSDHGYVVLPATYAYKQKGVQVREPAQIVCSLHKAANGWLITGWAWVGTKPKPGAAAAK